MKKYGFLIPLIGLLATSCAVTNKHDVILDDAGNPHYTKLYQDDKRGARAYPMKWAVGGKKLFVFNPKATAWAAYDAQGNRVMTGSASGGMDFCKDINEPCRTATGTFHVFNKKGADCRSNEYPIARDGKVIGGAKMPYCMHFHDGFAIHAAYEVPEYNTSHGCIRVLPGAAKWLSENFIDVGTTVLVQPYA
ncbi:MAG: L,D-transpeptidase [Legionellales bacterium]